MQSCWANTDHPKIPRKEVRVTATRAIIFAEERKVEVRQIRKLHVVSKSETTQVGTSRSICGIAALSGEVSWLSLDRGVESSRWSATKKWVSFLSKIDISAELAQAARLAAVTAVKKDGWPQDKGRKISKHVLRDFELDVDSIEPLNEPSICHPFILSVRRLRVRTYA